MIDAVLRIRLLAALAEIADSLSRLGPRRLSGKGQVRQIASRKDPIMALFLVLLLLAVVLVGLGFMVKWLFIAALIVAVLAAFSYFSGRSSRAI